MKDFLARTETGTVKETTVILPATLMTTMSTFWKCLSVRPSSGVAGGCLGDATSGVTDREVQSGLRKSQRGERKRRDP